MLNSCLIKQKFIIKQPEKPQRTDSVLNRPAIVKPPVKKTSQVRSNKLVKEKEENELSNYEKSKQKKMIATVLGPTKGKEHDLVPKITPICPSALPSNIIKCKIFFLP